MGKHINRRHTDTRTDSYIHTLKNTHTETITNTHIHKSPSLPPTNTQTHTHKFHPPPHTQANTKTHRQSQTKTPARRTPTNTNVNDSVSITKIEHTQPLIRRPTNFWLIFAFMYFLFLLYNMQSLFGA